MINSTTENTFLFQKFKLEDLISSDNGHICRSKRKELPKILVGSKTDFSAIDLKLEVYVQESSTSQDFKIYHLGRDITNQSK